MNAARQEAHAAHKARRARMQPPLLLRVPAPVLPMVRADPAVVASVKRQALRRDAKSERRRMLRAERRAAAETARQVRVATLLACVASHYAVEVDDLRGSTLTKRVTLARHVAVALAVDVLRFKTGQAVRVVERTHHSTAMAALRTVRCRCSSDDGFAGDYAALRRELQEKLNNG